MASIPIQNNDPIGLDVYPEGLSSDELKVLAFRNNIKNYGSLSRKKLFEKLVEIENINFEVKIDKDISELSQIEKRVLAQRIGITNIRNIPKKNLETILEEKVKNIDI